MTTSTKDYYEQIEEERIKAQAEAEEAQLAQDQALLSGPATRQHGQGEPGEGGAPTGFQGTGEPHKPLSDEARAGLVAEEEARIARGHEEARRRQAEAERLAEERAAGSDDVTLLAERIQKTESEDDPRFKTEEIPSWYLPSAPLGVAAVTVNYVEDLLAQIIHDKLREEGLLSEMPGDLSTEEGIKAVLSRGSLIAGGPGSYSLVSRLSGPVTSVATKTAVAIGTTAVGEIMQDNPDLPDDVKDYLKELL